MQQHTVTTQDQGLQGGTYSSTQSLRNSTQSLRRTRVCRGAHAAAHSHYAGPGSAGGHMQQHTVTTQDQGLQ